MTSHKLQADTAAWPLGRSDTAQRCTGVTAGPAGGAGGRARPWYLAVLAGVQRHGRRRVQQRRGGVLVERWKGES